LSFFLDSGALCALAFSGQRLDCVCLHLIQLRLLRFARAFDFRSHCRLSKAARCRHWHGLAERVTSSRVEGWRTIQGDSGAAANHSPSRDWNELYGKLWQQGGACFSCACGNSRCVYLTPCRELPRLRQLFGCCAVSLHCLKFLRWAIMSCTVLYSCFTLI
jgi:hypothetical protein